jgi:hypothetical protein
MRVILYLQFLHLILGPLKVRQKKYAGPVLREQVEQDLHKQKMVSQCTRR